MQIESFFDPRTFTLTYVVYDAETRDAVVIDPVLDYDPGASRTWTESADKLLAFIEQRALRLAMVLETHAHADHLSGSQHIKDHVDGVAVAIGERITAVQELFKGIFDLPHAFATDGSQFDRLLNDGEVVEIGPLRFEVLFTPGHTPACASYRFVSEDAGAPSAIFTGDALFMPDQGTGRCDFPAGSAADLYRSVTTRLYTLPDETRVFVGHDYQPGGRELRYESTIGEQKKRNVQLPAGLPEPAFVERREARDAQLQAPRLLFQSVQVNIDAGRLPAPAANEIRYLRLPLNVFRPAG